eukprot:gene9844-6916_t
MGQGAQVTWVTQVKQGTDSIGVRLVLLSGPRRVQVLNARAGLERFTSQSK